MNNKLNTECNILVCQVSENLGQMTHTPVKSVKLVYELPHYAKKLDEFKDELISLISRLSTSRKGTVSYGIYFRRLEKIKNETDYAIRRIEKETEKAKA